MAMRYSGGHTQNRSISVLQGFTSIGGACEDIHFTEECSCIVLTETSIKATPAEGTIAATVYIMMAVESMYTK